MKDLDVIVRIHDQEPRALTYEDAYLPEDPWVREEHAQWGPPYHGIDVVEVPAGIRGVSVWTRDLVLLQWHRVAPPAPADCTIHIPGVVIS